MTTMFLGDVEFFQRFFKKCVELGLEGEKERLQLLVDMAKEGNGQECSIIQTNRDEDTIVEDMAKHYGKVLRIKPNEE